jgi:hypothetical protein
MLSISVGRSDLIVSRKQYYAVYHEMTCLGTGR